MLSGIIHTQIKLDAPASILNDINDYLNTGEFKTKQLPLKSATVKWCFTNAQQPPLKDVLYHDIENNIVYLFDGYIYNLDELAANLFIPAHLHLPLYIISKAFITYGEQFAEHLNGDFSIIIFKEHTQETLFYRDHLGLRPLAVSLKNDSIYFSTNPMGLCKALYGKEKIDLSFLLNKFTVEDITGNLMTSSKVLSVKAGHYLKVTGAQFEQKKYWFPEKIQTDHTLNQQQVLKDLKQLVQDAVSIRLDKSKNASAHLSGGLDSGVVAALTRTAYQHQEQFYGFSWSPQQLDSSDDPHAIDERIFVNKIARQNNITPIFTSMDADSYQAFIQDWQHPRELLYESKTIQEAKNRNINLIFSGWGGDEFISIGHRGIDSDLIRQGKWKSFLKKYPVQQPRNLLRAVIFSALFPSIRRPYSKFKVSASIYPYLKNTIGSNVIPKKKRFVYNSRRKVHLQLLEMGHLGARAADWYVYGQRYGIEYRYPLLDKRIVEYMIKVPSNCLVGNNNYRILLREIGKGLLPMEVLNNKSKSDPVKDQNFFTVAQRFEKQYISEFQDFKNNPDLAFINFDLLQKNMTTILENVKTGNENDETEIFYNLKHVHEFTKAYYR
jgi:asparagine synthase (glutamine-hydrolysing)